MGSVYIRNLRIFAHHGVLPQERTVGAYFILNISIVTDFSDATESDSVTDTISYADVLQTVRSEMAVPSNLIEHAAARVAKAILLRFPQAEAVNIDILKQNPPMGADCDGAGVTITFFRNDLL